MQREEDALQLIQSGGLTFMDNDAVNLLATTVGAVVGLLFAGGAR